MRLYLRRLRKLFLPYFTIYLLAGVPLYVLGFTVLPQYIGHREPVPYAESMLMGLIFALVVALLAPLIVKNKKAEK